MSISTYIEKLEKQNEDLKHKLYYLEKLIDKKFKLTDFLNENGDKLSSLVSDISRDFLTYKDLLYNINKDNSFEILIENMNDFVDLTLDYENLSEEFLKLQVDKVDYETGEFFLEEPLTSPVPLDKEFSVEPNKTFRRFY